jgi:hypothetical protein
MDNPYDAFYKAMDNLGKELNQKRKAVQTDKDRSPSGREKELAKLEAEYGGQIATLEKRYHDALAETQRGYEKTLNGPPKPLTALDKLRMKINKAPAMEFEYLDDDSRTAAIIESNEKVISALEKSSFINMASRMDPKELLSVTDNFRESGNLSALENLAEVANFRGDALASQKIAATISYVKEASLTPAQKIARIELQRLDNHKRLFDWGIKEVKAGREFQDLRGKDSDRDLDIQLAQINASTTNET